MVDGASVGFIVGDLLGMGEKVGFTDKVINGPFDSCTAGLEEGKFVGAVDGQLLDMIEGCTAGVSDGDSTGCIDEYNVGNREG